MLSYLKEETNYTFTENGARAKATTTSDLLDFFAQAGAMRKRSESDIISAFTYAMAEDELLALKALFYFRDVREGQGERRLFRIIIRHLAKNHTDLLKKNLHLIAYYGRWDDIYELFGTPLEQHVGVMLRNQLNADLRTDRPSLMAKWLHSENTSSYKSKQLGKRTRELLGLSSKNYRKILSSLREKLNIVERKMSGNDWYTIDYPKLPSKAGLLYRKAFLRHDEEGYRAFLDGLEKGTQKINVKTLFPYELVSKVNYRKSFYSDRREQMSIEDERLLNQMWESLPNYIGDKKEDSLAVIDVSGSMHGLPIEVAISLGLYMAERNTGAFHNHFMTFSTEPSLEEVKGSTFCERVRNISDANWSMTTNIKAVFDLILKTAVDRNLPQEEMVSKLYIISDMEFDRADRSFGRQQETLFETIRKEYRKKGYEMPNLVFWNVDARNTQFPVSINEHGVQLVSGCSPTLFQQIMEGKNAYDLMVDILNSERYTPVQL